VRTDPSRPDTRTLPPGTRAGWPTGEADERLVTRHSEGNSAETTTSTGADGTQTFASKTELALRLVSHPMRVRQYRPGCPGDCPGLIHLVRDPAPLVRLPLAGRLTGTDSWTCRPESASYAPGLDSTNHPTPACRVGSAGVGITGPVGSRFWLSLVRCPKARRFSPLAGRSHRRCQRRADGTLTKGGRAKARAWTDGLRVRTGAVHSGSRHAVAAMGW
jgi:hypothetical protein